ncbi:unnamed protein product [marine sediment metagenome]|uniref:Class I SAM-dependent methyltransferase n=1 Tax=marine sediment metagenome TaxID=412755 RepID=X0U008_9ZZZZ
MLKTNIRNVLAQALNQRRFPVMLKKLWRRLVDDKGLLTKEENLKWIQSHCSDFEALAKELGPALWEDAENFGKGADSKAEETLRNIEYSLGGGAGISPFLYFVTRYMESNCIVETGVAAGYSSCAFLSAIKTTGKGRLYSSDFPYFRLPDPERLIGILVDESLKDNWELYIDGDEKNLPRILDKVDQIDIFHYDSDKSYSGRKFAMSAVKEKMNKNGLIIMDDIQDNSYFHDYIKINEVPTWYIFKFAWRHVGVIGNLTTK